MLPPSVAPDGDGRDGDSRRMRGDMCGELDALDGIEPSIGDVFGDNGDIFDAGWTLVPPGAAKLTRPRENPARGFTCARARAASTLPVAPDFHGATTASGSISARMRARFVLDPGEPLTPSLRALAGSGEVTGRCGVKEGDGGEPCDGSDSFASL